MGWYTVPHMSKYVSVGMGLVVVLVVGGIVFTQRQGDLAPAVDEHTPEAALPTDAPADATAPAPQQGVVEKIDVQKAAPLTLSVVATHASRSSCWTVINGTVYDLTSWIPQHPGGESAILRLCGVDGSARYNAQHGGGKKQEAILLGFALGPLAP